MYLVYYVEGEFTHIVGVVTSPKVLEGILKKYELEGIEAKYHKINYIYKL